MAMLESLLASGLLLSSMALVLPNAEVLDLLKKGNAVLCRISTSVPISTQNAGFRRGSREQHSGPRRVNRTIIQLDQTIRQNASVAEEIASTLEQLSQAEQWQDTIHFFKSDMIAGKRFRDFPRSAKKKQAILPVPK